MGKVSDQIDAPYREPPGRNWQVFRGAGFVLQYAARFFTAEAQREIYDVKITSMGPASF
jgi:hypothetical protein